MTAAHATPARCDHPSPDGWRLFAIAIISVACLAFNLMILVRPEGPGPYSCPIDEHGRLITNCTTPCVGPDGELYQGLMMTFTPTVRP